MEVLIMLEGEHKEVLIMVGGRTQGSTDSDEGRYLDSLVQCKAV